MEMDRNIATMAAGYVADELPQSYIPIFLNKIDILKKTDIFTES